MKPKYFKNILFATVLVLIMYAIFCGFTYFGVKWFTDAYGSDIDINNVNVAYKTWKVLFIGIYISMLFRIFFYRNIINKKIIEKAKKVNMIVPSKERYNQIMQEDYSKILIRNWFIRKLDGNSKISLTGETYWVNAASRNFNFYIGNEQGELMFIVNVIRKDYPTFLDGYSIFDPFNNDIGEIKKVKPFMVHKSNYKVKLKDKPEFNIVFDKINMISRRVNSTKDVLEIINLPLKLDNDFLDEKRLINLNCHISTNLNEAVAETQSSDVLGNSEMIIINNKYKLEAVFLYMCLILEKYYLDGVNTKIVMPEDLKKKTNNS